MKAIVHYTRKGLLFGALRVGIGNVGPGAHRQVVCGARGRLHYSNRQERVTCPACIEVLAVPKCQCADRAEKQPHNPACPVSIRQVDNALRALDEAMRAEIP